MKLEELEGIIKKRIFLYNEREILEYDQLTINELIDKGYGAEKVIDIKTYKNTINITVE